MLSEAPGAGFGSYCWLGCLCGGLRKIEEDHSAKLSGGLVSCWVRFEDDILAWGGSTGSDRVKRLGRIWTHLTFVVPCSILNHAKL